MKRRFALACLTLALCGVFAAGCDTRSAAPENLSRTGSPRQETSPTVTLADPLARNALLQNEAYYAGLTATAVVQNGIATQSALLQMTETARQASVRGTALAVEVQATATAAHLALQQQQAQISMAATATVSAQRQADTLATQLAAEVEARRLQAQERARAEAWAELDRQTGFVVRAGLSALAVIALAVLIYHGARWLSVIVAIDARRRLVMERAGLVFDHQAGRWELLPGQSSGLNRSSGVAPRPDLVEESGCGDAPAPRPGWLAKLEAKRAERQKAFPRTERPPAFALPDPVALERRKREEWTVVCRWFLLWSAVPARDGRPTTLSLRRMQSTTQWVTGQKLTRPDWEKCRDVLVRLGVIEPEPGGSYVLRGGASAEAACHFPVWATSWPVPDDVQLPKIVEPPRQSLANLGDAARLGDAMADSGVTSPAQHSTAHTDTHTPARLHRPAQPETPPEFEILGTYAGRVATGASNPDD